MLKIFISAGFFLLMLMAVPFVHAQDLSIRNQTYICERGVALPVVFLKDQERSYAVLSVDGKLISMREDKTDSSHLFIAIDDQDSYRLHIQGNNAFLSYKDSDDVTKTDRVILQSCQADIAED